MVSPRGIELIRQLEYSMPRVCLNMSYEEWKSDERWELMTHALVMWEPYFSGMDEAFLLPFVKDIGEKKYGQGYEHEQEHEQ